MPRRQSPATVEQIMIECRKAMRKGLGKKSLTLAANNYWEANHLAAVTKQVAGGANCYKDRKRALPVATKLGKIAAVLAGKGMVAKWAAEAAHEAVKRDPGCPAVGAGGYCDF